jgi:hypothetical protein
MNKKTVIHEFDPCIYPRLLWVVKGGELEEIRKTLEFGELGDDEQKGGAVTISAYDNANKKGGFLVWFPKSGEMSNLDWIAHESTHVALGIFDYIGSEVAANESEPFAYLVGWVFGCIDKVRKYKEVKHGNYRKESESNDTQEVQLEEACEEAQEDAGR